MSTEPNDNPYGQVPNKDNENFAQENHTPEEVKDSSLQGKENNTYTTDSTIPSVPQAPTGYPGYAVPNSANYNQGSYNQTPNYGQSPYAQPQNPVGLSPYGQNPQYAQNQQYPAPQYQGGFQNNVSPEYYQGLAHAQKGMVFGIIGLIFLPLIFGVLALVEASKANRLGASATPAKVLGWIAVVFGVIGVLFMMLGLLGTIVSM